MDLKTLNKREATLVNLIASGAMRRRRIITIWILVAVYTVAFTLFLRLEGNITRMFTGIIARQQSHVVQIKTTTALEHKLKLALFEADRERGILLVSFLSTIFHAIGVTVLSGPIILCAFLLDSAQRDTIIKKLVDAQKLGSE